MAIEQVSIRDCFVFRDDTLTHRWYDAVGPHVVKYELNVAGCPTDDTTGMPTEFTNTLVNASTFAHTDVAGGAVLLTADTAENDGVKLQLGDELAGAGESVTFAARYPTYFGVTLQINDVDQTDFLAGFCVTDTACLDAVADGIYFRSVDETGVVNFVLEQDSVETVNAVNTMTDATNVVLEFLYWGSNISAYVNGVLAVTVADSDANFCNDELLRLTFEFLTGEAIANTCTITQLQFIQIQN
jgi:hypothetical protein